ncbi:transposase [Escherichia coli]|uniref:Putative transposase n=2 Tax=Escherichia coli TaxID=562 RepID=A0A836N748_ECOLX|nr:putative transposase [Escherichia coli 2848050]END34476.1 putative transposase [Escherichia coli 179100]END66232.1 putative transposase [Escherichia coli P0299483.1]END85215.1 putative transposase [Escherichia coli P0299483.2]END87459.1 putative transposase [Escherichia coli P0299483.3]EST00658.1 Mobile element protein [Escherichia coli CE418]KEJ18064.1 putative transposase [Escherichia coli 6-175-07_S1_C2]KEJ49975.1 putative transposase [Escherichia coli 2-427-07_S4_C3]KEJ64092.1 putati
MALICELDEQWSFVENKARQQWHWYAYKTKADGVLAYTFGPRTDETCRELPEFLKPFSADMITRDNRSSYTREMPQDKHLVGKIFTRRIERNNLTLRTHIKRPARKTICFLRSLEIHEKPLVHLSKTHVLLTGVITRASFAVFLP